MNNNSEFNSNDFTLDGNGFGGAPAPQQKDHARLSVIFGVLGIVIGCCCIPAGVLLGVFSVMFAFKDKVRYGSFSPVAVAGALCGALAIVLGVAMFIANLIMVANGGMDEFYAQLEQFLNEMSNAN